MSSTYEQANRISVENIPDNGYLLAPVEQVQLERDLSDGMPEGSFTLGNQPIPYMNIVGIRVGGETTYADLTVIASPTAAGSYADGLLLVRSTNPDHLSSTPVPVANTEDGLLIGRGNFSFKDLPLSVSRAHVRIVSEGAGKLSIQNLSPTNKTILFRTALAASERSLPEDPEEMAATLAIDPISGESLAGPVVNAHRPWEIINPSTGLVAQRLEVSDSESLQRAEDELRRTRQRRRAANQLRQMRLS